MTYEERQEKFTSKGYIFDELKRIRADKDKQVVDFG